MLNHLLKILIFALITYLTIRIVFDHRVRYQVTYYYPIPFSIRHYVVWPDEGPNSSRLQNLETISWPNYNRPTKLTAKQMEDLRPFEIRLSLGQHATLVELLKVFQQTMVVLGCQDQWFISGQTLLGCLQHHDIIPWDDGVELFTSIEKRSLIQEKLKLAEPKFLLKSLLYMDLLYMEKVDDVKEMDHNAMGSFQLYRTPWPYITIRYFEKINASTLQEDGNSRLRFNISDIFPTTYRPLGRFWYPAPKRPVTFLKNLFSYRQQASCESLAYSNALEKSLEAKSQECRELLNQFAFVHRCPIPKNDVSDNKIVFCDEYLVDGSGKSIHKIRTTLFDLDQLNLSFHNPRHESFQCP